MYPMRSMQKIKSTSSHSSGCDYMINIYCFLDLFHFNSERYTVENNDDNSSNRNSKSKKSWWHYNVLIDTQNQIIKKSNNDRDTSRI
jgi:hypothetical protein